jgi:hypothetical protein
MAAFLVSFASSTYISLLANILVDSLMLNVSINLTLHHRASIVVLNEAFPARLRHRGALREALFAEIFDRVVVSVGQEVVDLVLLSVVFQPVHEPCAVTLDLLGRRDREEHNLSELLRVKRAEYAATQDDWSLALLLLNDYHGFVHSIHNQSHDVRTRHPWKLLGDDVLQVNQMSHALQRPKYD